MAASEGALTEILACEASKIYLFFHWGHAIFWCLHLKKIFPILGKTNFCSFCFFTFNSYCGIYFSTCVNKGKSKWLKVSKSFPPFVFEQETKSTTVLFLYITLFTKMCQFKKNKSEHFAVASFILSKGRSTAFSFEIIFHIILFNSKRKN